MANVLVERQSLVDAANAIRQQLGTQDSIKPSDFDTKIAEISGGGESKNYGTVTVRDVTVDYDPNQTSISGGNYQLTVTDIDAFWHFALDQNAVQTYFNWQQSDPSQTTVYMYINDAGTRWYIRQGGESWSSAELAQYGLNITGSGQYANLTVEFIVTPTNNTTQLLIRDVLDYYSLGFISTSSSGEMSGGQESTFSVNGTHYARSQVAGFTFGPDATFTPDYFLANCYLFNAPITIPATMQKIGNYFMYRCTHFDSAITIAQGVTKIPNSFCTDCYYLNTAVSIPASVTSIGTSFLYNDISFNQPVSFPEVTRLGGSCLSYCTNFNNTISFPKLQTYEGSLLNNSTSFNRDITFPATLVEFDPYYTLYNCNNMTSTIYVETSLVPSGSDYRVNSCFSMSSNSVRAYTTGIKVGGTYGATWRTYLPNRSSSPYRKLLAA